MPSLSLSLQNGWSLNGAGCVLVDGVGVGGGESGCRNILDKNLGEAKGPQSAFGFHSPFLEALSVTPNLR